VPGGGLMYRYVGGLGVRFDSTTGLYYMRQRWYDPTLQRFVSRDPDLDLPVSNHYIYAENNPTTIVDPDGLKPRQKDVIWFVKVVTRGSGRGRGNYVEFVKRIKDFETAIERVLRGQSISCPNNFRLAQQIANAVASRFPGARAQFERHRGAQQYSHFHVKRRAGSQWVKVLPAHIFFEVIPGLPSDVLNLIFEGRVDRPVLWNQDPQGKGGVIFGPVLFPFPGFIKYGEGLGPQAMTSCECANV